MNERWWCEQALFRRMRTGTGTDNGGSAVSLRFGGVFTIESVVVTQLSQGVPKKQGKGTWAEYFSREAMLTGVHSG
jgi:hypothetical protein